MEPGPQTTRRRYRILVIDDDPATAEIVASWYSGQPYDVSAEEDGESGLERALSADPDVILLDLTLPGIDGISVAKRLKTDGRLQKVPVILLTACRNLEAKVEAFGAGVDDFMTKPFDCEEMDARIQGMLRRREFLTSLESAIRDLTASNEQLEQLLIIDEKTGLNNFREFQRRMRDEWQRAERYAVPLSLVFLDLDRFKSVNDTLGHQAGDEVLREFAMLVAGGARASDVAARYGGEEFAVILPHTDDRMARRVAERIRSAVEEFVFLRDETPTRVTVSAGVATYQPPSTLESVDDLLRAADRALYLAKDLGRNRIVHLDDVDPADESLASGADGLH